MRIPQFWARAKQMVPGPSHGIRLLLWGWSDESIADAKANAEERLRQRAAWIEAGHGPLEKYAYGDRPLREEIIGNLAGPDGATAAIVTRNNYGSLVLNTARALFIDVDVPELAKAPKKSILFWRKGPAPNELEAPALGRLRTALQAADASFRWIFDTALTDLLQDMGFTTCDMGLGTTGAGVGLGGQAAWLSGSRRSTGPSATPVACNALPASPAV